MSGLEFEKPIIELEAKIEELKQSGKSKRDAVATKATIVAAALEEFARVGLA